MPLELVNFNQTHDGVGFLSRRVTENFEMIKFSIFLLFAASTTNPLTRTNPRYGRIKASSESFLELSTLQNVYATSR